MKNAMFIHAGSIDPDKYGSPNTDRCQFILDDISSHIIKSKIYEQLDSIFLEIVGHNNLNFNVPKATISHNGDDIYQWEFPTLYKIIKYAKENPDAKILYVHTKGSSSGTQVAEFKWIEDVRSYQLYQNIVRFKECLNYLNEYDTCGAELIHIPVTHYSQNFWWANAKYINTLIDPVDLPIIYDHRHRCEFWICSNPKVKFKSIFNIYNHFINSTDFSKSMYMDRESWHNTDMQPHFSHEQYFKNN